MKAENINAFIKASTDVLGQIAGLTFKLGKVYMKNDGFKPPEISILIGITGDLKGRAVLSMNRSIGLKIVSSMMGGMEVKEFDEISKSALSEVGNMVMGNAATNLSSQEIKVDITPPTLMIGESFSIHTSGNKLITIPLETQYGTIELGVAVEEITK